MISPLDLTVVAFIYAFETLNLQTFLDVLAEDAEYIIAPESAGFPRLTVPEGLTEQINDMKEVLHGLKLHPKEIIENEERGQVTIWAVGTANFKAEVKDSGLSEEEWTYRGEYMFVLTLDDMNERITRVVEFLDSLATLRLMGLVVRARENLERARMDLERASETLERVKEDLAKEERMEEEGKEVCMETE